MVISAGIVLICFGLMCLFQRDIAWMLYEADARFAGKQRARTPDWDQLMVTQGIVLVMIGIIGVLVGFR